MMHNSHWKSWSFPPLLGGTVMSFRGIFQKSIPRCIKKIKVAWLFYPSISPFSKIQSSKIPFLSKDYNSLGTLPSIEGFKKLKSSMWCNYNQQVSADDWGSDLNTEPLDFTVAQKLGFAFSALPFPSDSQHCLLPPTFPKEVVIYSIQEDICQQKSNPKAW